MTKENNQIVGTGRKEDKEHHRDIINENEVTDRVNAIDNDSSKSVESFLEDFRRFKKWFLAEVNVFKKQLLKSYTTDNIDKSNNSDRLIIEHTSIQNNLQHYTKMLTMHLLKKTLTIVKIIHRLKAVTSIQKARN